MKYIYLSLLLLLLNACYKGKSVDLVIHNARVHVMNDKMEIFEAIAISDGKIVEVGPERQILNKYAAKKTINAQLKEVYPGFHDSHGHIMSLAKQMLNADLRGSRSYYEVISLLEKHQSKTKQSILIGRGWDQSIWGEEDLPNNQLLNESFPTTPVALTRIDGHAMLINQAMMDFVGIDENTTVEGGDFIQEDGQLTGILLDHALDLVNAKLPAPKKEDLKKAILTIQDQLLAAGITSVHEAGLDEKERDLFIELADENKWRLSIYAMLFPTEGNLSFAWDNGHYENNNLSIRSFKVITDGALGSYGACLLHPYSDRTQTSGMLLKTPAQLTELFNKAKALDYQLNSHCIGDSANRLVLQMVDTLMRDKADHRWRIEHAQIIHPDDIELFSSSRILPSVQPTHATSDQRWAEQRLGKTRLNHGSYAYNSLQKEAGMILFGTDFPIEHYDPFATIHAATQRKNTENEPMQGFLSDEAVSLETTLKAMTLWAAFGSFNEKNEGSLEKGKKANLVIFDKPVQSTARYLPNYAWITITDGEVVFDMR